MRIRLRTSPHGRPAVSAYAPRMDRLPRSPRDRRTTGVADDGAGPSVAAGPAFAVGPAFAAGPALATGPAVRDATEILARAAEDEAAADQARERYRTAAMASLEPDARIGPLLARDERVVAVRRSAMLDRRQPVIGWDQPTGLGGDLYVTSKRLALVGSVTLSFELDEVEDAMLSGERLLLVLRGGQGISIDASRPRLLRVEIATARAAARR